MSVRRVPVTLPKEVQKAGVNDAEPLSVNQWIMMVLVSVVENLAEVVAAENPLVSVVVPLTKRFKIT